MKLVVRLVLLSVFGVTLAATTANAAPIVCSATLVNGNGQTKFYEGSVDPAVSCSIPIIGNNVFPSNLTAFGFTWVAQDKDEIGVAGPQNGASEDVLTITGINGTAGTFTIDPTDSQCGPLDCNSFVFGLKFGHAVAFWDLGNITTPTTFNWTTNRAALSNGAVYGRVQNFDINAPEPGVMLLLATGAAIGLRRRLTASR